MHDVDDGTWAATIACRFGNALLLVEAVGYAGESPAHDGFDGRAPVYRDRDSLYVGVRHGSDGPVRVDVVAGAVVPPPDPGLECRFDGVLDLPRRRVLITDVPDGQVRMTVPTDTGRQRVRIHTDDSREPSRVLVLFEPA